MKRPASQFRTGRGAFAQPGSPRRAAAWMERRVQINLWEGTLGCACCCSWAADALKKMLVLACGHD